MKTLIWGTVAATAFVLSGTANAEGNIYLGGQVLQYDIDVQHVNIANGAKPHGVQLVFGGEVAKYAAVEMRAGRSASYDELPQDESVSAKIDATFGLYAKAQFPLGNVKPYAIIGFSKYDVDTSSTSGEKDSLTDSDVSTGIGVSVLPIKNLQVSAEFMRVSDENTNKIGAKVFSSSVQVAYVFGN